MDLYDVGCIMMFDLEMGVFLGEGLNVEFFGILFVEVVVKFKVIQKLCEGEQIKEIWFVFKFVGKMEIVYVICVEVEVK